MYIEKSERYPDGAIILEKGDSWDNDSLWNTPLSELGLVDGKKYKVTDSTVEEVLI